MWVADAAQILHCCGYSSDSIPSLGTSICHGSGLRNGKKTKKKKKKLRRQEYVEGQLKGVGWGGVGWGGVGWGGGEGR